MSKIQVIRQGESLPFKFDRGGASTDGWTCNIQVKEFPASSPIVNRVIPLVDGVWAGFLTQTETSPLAIGLYYLTALLSNTTTDEEEQVPLRFNASTAWQ